MVLFKRISGMAVFLLGALFIAVGISIFFDKSEETSTAVGCIVIGAIPMLFGSWLLWSSRAQLQNEKSKTLDKAFYALLQNGEATIADFDFAVQNKITLQEAREFLEKKCTELGVSADANDRGMVTYTFGG